MEKNINELISEAIIELGLSDSSMAPILKVWAMEAMGEIGASRLQFKETDWLLIDDLRVDKPKDMIAPIQIEISIDKQHCIQPYFDPNLAKCDCCHNCSSGCGVKMGENQTQFYFDSTALKYNGCKIRYVGLPCDEQGEPLIEDSAKRAVKQYLQLLNTKRERKRDRNAVPQSEVESEDRKWITLKGQAAGRINMPTLIEMPSIVNQFYNAGITVDMFLERYNGYWSGYGYRTG